MDKENEKNICTEIHDYLSCYNELGDEIVNLKRERRHSAHEAYAYLLSSMDEVTSMVEDMSLYLDVMWDAVKTSDYTRECDDVRSEFEQDLFKMIHYLLDIKASYQELSRLMNKEKYCY